MDTEAGVEERRQVGPSHELGTALFDQVVAEVENLEGGHGGGAEVVAAVGGDEVVV